MKTILISLCVLSIFAGLASKTLAQPVRTTLGPAPNTAAIAEHVAFDFSRAQSAVSNQTVAAQTSLKVATNLDTTPE